MPPPPSYASLLAGSNVVSVALELHLEPLLSLLSSTGDGHLLEAVSCFLWTILLPVTPYPQPHMTTLFALLTSLPTLY